MLAEVRSLVALQDLELFDRLVVHHDLQAWPGGLGAAPQCACSLPAPQDHEPGHSASLVVSLETFCSSEMFWPVRNFWFSSGFCSVTRERRSKPGVWRSREHVGAAVDGSGPGWLGLTVRSSSGDQRPGSFGAPQEPLSSDVPAEKICSF